MPISKLEMIRCKKCKKRFGTMIGDVRPQNIICTNCGCEHVYFDNRKYIALKTGSRESEKWFWNK